jgi:hypothetical protein
MTMNEHDDSNVTTADDWLERALVDDGREHRAGYLADAGFTARVAAALPAPPALPAWRKPAVAALWTVAGVGIAMALPGAVADTATDLIRLAGRHPVTLAQLMIGLLALGTTGWAGAVYALRRED